MLSSSVSMEDVLKLVATTLDARDRYTFEHSFRVATLATLMARELGLSEEQVSRVAIVAHLHDIGKVAISNHILHKPGVLTHQQYDEVQMHTEVGFTILQQIPTFACFANSVKYHHERWDGKGYPEGLVGDAIPLESRVIALADAFDAMTSDRPYRSRASFDQGFAEIEKNCGSQFCPECVEAFRRIKRQLRLKLYESNRVLENRIAFPQTLGRPVRPLHAI